MTRTIMTVGLAVLLATAAMAQTATQDISITVTEGAAIAITDQDVSFTVAAPTAAGDDPAIAPTNADTNYLKYTNLSDGTPDKITVKLNADVPGGLKLSATPTVPAGLGTAAAVGALSTIAQDIVTGIGSCATGTAATNGAKIVYGLTIDNLANVAAGSTNLVATYTFTDVAP